MLLSFSVKAMMPYLQAGILQKAGRLVDRRVKRQTIRASGPRADRLIAHARAHTWRGPGVLHLWWKSRTKERKFLGMIDRYRVYPIQISHRAGGRIGILGPCGSSLSWTPKDGGALLKSFALADGFDSVEAFRDYFVPTEGQEFKGVVFKW